MLWLRCLVIHLIATQRFVDSLAPCKLLSPFVEQPLVFIITVCDYCKMTPFSPFLSSPTVPPSLPPFLQLVVVVLALCWVPHTEASAQILASKIILNQHMVEGRDLTVKYSIYNVGTGWVHGSPLFRLYSQALQFMRNLGMTSFYKRHHLMLCEVVGLRAEDLCKKKKDLMKFSTQGPLVSCPLCLRRKWSGLPHIQKLLQFTAYSTNQSDCVFSL